MGAGSKPRSRVKTQKSPSPSSRISNGRTCWVTAATPSRSVAQVMSGNPIVKRKLEPAAGASAAPPMGRSAWWHRRPRRMGRSMVASALADGSQVYGGIGRCSLSDFFLSPWLPLHVLRRRARTLRIALRPFLFPLPGPPPASPLELLHRFFQRLTALLRLGQPRGKALGIFRRSLRAKIDSATLRAKRNPRHGSSTEHPEALILPGNRGKRPAGYPPR